jgi:hypothetical protein
VTEREGSCSCGQLRVTVSGEPVRVSICHCFACQQRTGSSYGYQARFPEDRKHGWVVPPHEAEHIY